MSVNLPNDAATRNSASIPGRGDIVPSLTGLNADGHAVSLRDFYLRRNLAIVFVNDDPTGAEWLSEAANVREAAAAEIGEIFAIVPTEMDTHGLPTIIDAGGTQRARFGLGEEELPALFITDRYLTLFAANRGVATDDLDPTKIPEWLEFVSAQCS
jgi:hypothetical protein